MIKGGHRLGALAVTGLLAASAAVATSTVAASSSAAPKLAARADSKGFVSGAWTVPKNWCSFSLEVLTSQMGGRIYSEFLKCNARAHKTTEAFSPGANNQGRTLYVRVAVVPKGAAANCLKNARSPLCLAEVTYSALAVVRILPRATVVDPTTGTGSNAVHRYDGTYEVTFEVKESTLPIPKVGQKLTGLRFEVKSLAMSGDFSGTISRATGKASNRGSILGLDCVWNIGFKPSGAGVAAEGDATCNNGAVAGKIKGKRT